MDIADNDIDFTAIIAELNNNNNDDGWQSLAIGTSVITTNCIQSARPAIMVTTTSTSTTEVTPPPPAAVTPLPTSITGTAAITPSPTTSTATAPPTTTTAATVVKEKKSRKPRRPTLVTSAPKKARLTGETIASSSAYVLTEGDRALDLLVPSTSTSPPPPSTQFLPSSTVTMSSSMNPLYRDAQVWSLVNDVRVLKRLLERQHTILERYGDELRDIKGDIARLARGGRITFGM